MFMMFFFVIQKADAGTNNTSATCKKNQFRIADHDDRQIIYTSGEVPAGSRQQAEHCYRAWIIAQPQRWKWSVTPKFWLAVTRVLFVIQQDRTLLSMQL
jgi:hypothetical protein